MSFCRKFLVTTAYLVCLAFLAAGVTAAPGIQTFQGDRVTISGYATSGPWVYLFLTGPNLPVNGVALNDITKRADQGGFTKVSVDGADDRWTYTWDTKSINGRLDEGTYTIWVVSGPNDRSRLAEADYRTISVTLGKPFVSVDTPAVNGGMDLQSVPDGASIQVNGEFRGKTPRIITGLAPGNYAVIFTLPGYVDLAVQVPVEGGADAQVIATLTPETGTLAVNSTPEGAQVFLDGTYAGISPVMLANISAGNHTLRLEQAGYLAATRTIAASAGQTGSVEIVLEPVPRTTTRAAGLVPALSGMFLLVLLGIARRGRGNR